MSTDTGRIRRAVGATAQRILFGATVDHAIDGELAFVAQVDRAHVVMLAERGLVEPAVAATLLAEIEALRESDFAALRGRPAPRGAYLCYEQHLVERTGIACGGMLQLGRSRNDLNATILRLRLRAPVAALIREVMRLQVILIRRAARFGAVVMPAYTHGQPAVPITYGHYLAGVASAIARDLDGLVQASADLDALPLGAGAVGGTSWSIDTGRTAELLGFVGAVPNSVDAVASRDGVLRLLAAAVVLGVTLSRTATDHLAWLGPEHGFLALPDHLVGSSSMMPQKRNPYFLEHVQGKSAAAVGAFTHATIACHAKPFTNAIAVGTEAMAPVLGALTETTHAVTLLRLVLAEIEVRPAAMRARAEEGLTAATELANRLVASGGMSFRAAHHQVGEIATAALTRGQRLEDAAADWRARTGAGVSLDGLDVASVVARTGHGGGPAPDTLATCLAGLRRTLRDHGARSRAMRRRWAHAAELSRAAAAEVRR